MFKKSHKNPVQGADSHKKYWKILIVDDEPEVHSITKVALSEFSYDDKDVEMISAYSGAEAKAVCQNEPDIALIYLDVVMETDTAGLEVVQYIRNELKNNFVRIILRTGQPGQAPEREVIVNYDINDYKEKTLLDSGKLFTSTYSALRAYNDIMNVERSRVMLDRYRSGLEKVIESTANLFELRSLQNFANGLLVQLGSLLHIDRDTILLRSHGYTVVHNDGEQFELLAATGDLGKRIASEPEVHHTSDLLPPKVNQDLLTCLQTRKSIVREDVYVGYFPTKSGKINLLYLDGVGVRDDLDLKLIEIFSTNVTIAFDNLYLDKEIYDTQVEIIDTLGDVVETRSKETANHVRRVAHLSRLLAKAYGLDVQSCDQLYMAAPMHDIGKVAIPDRVLLKPGKLDEEEWEIMKTHAKIGEDIFVKSNREVLQAAALVAGQHHEKFDGSGYPRGLAGEDIHIFGRIVAVVDVFDALVHKRCYKEAWPMEDVLALLESEKGKHFDPRLVELLVEHLPAVEEILQTYPDSEH